MHQTHFIVREPLLDPKQRVIGYELCWQQRDGQALGDADLERLVAFVAEHVVDEEQGWLLRDKILFLDAVPAMLSLDALHALPPERTVLSLRVRDLANADTRAAVQALRAGGVGISIRGADLSLLGKNLTPFASYAEVRFTGADVAAQARAYAAAKQSALRLVGRPVATWADFDACAALGLDAFVGKLHLTPREGGNVKGMNPAQAIILQLMQMVQNNEDVPKIEAVLKRDPALIYKLLRFINSAGFGLSREITSFRQAVMLLGLKKLFRWAALLLTASRAGGLPSSVGQTAVVRGRLMELLALETLPPEEADQAFVVGIFSLLDVMLSMPMESALGLLSVPEPVAAALLRREGFLGDLLTLAEACESSDDAMFNRAAGLLHLSSQQINLAHLQALAWADHLGD